MESLFQGRTPKNDNVSQNIITAIQQLLENNRTMSIKNYLDSSDACIYLGVAKSYLYKLTHHKVIPYFKTGKKIYFNREDLDTYITKFKFNSKDEIIKRVNNHLNN